VAKGRGLNIYPEGNKRNKGTKEEIKTFNLQLKFNDIQVSMHRCFVKIKGLRYLE